MINMAASTSMLVKKFKGSFVGSLVGDCLGAMFENADIPIASNQGRIVQFINSFRNGKMKPGSLEYTDDTATTKELALSLINNGSINKEDLAKRLTELYYAEPYRGFGSSVEYIYSSFRHQTSFKDVLKPAREQFNGTGSYGNGAAMRVSPIGLFFHNSPEKVAHNAGESACITHAHLYGVNGAILHALAIREAAVADENEPVDPVNFLDRLKEEIDCRESRLYHSSAGLGPFSKKLTIVDKLLKEPKTPSIEQIVLQLGNDVQALKSVPTAIYVFLASQKPIDGIEATNVFERMIQYVLLIGGDTDTIGNMAGGICGAYFGEDIIPRYLIDPCEGYEDMLNIAENLYSLAAK